MEEEKLIKWLIVTGIVSFSVIAVSNFLFSNLIIKFSSFLVPLTICQTDSKGSYLLAQPASYSLCSQLEDIDKLIGNPVICDGYDANQKNACLKLIEIAKNRTRDCIGIAFGKNQTSVNPIEVEESCALLNTTIVPPKEINNSLSIVGSIAGKAILPINKFLVAFQ